MTTSLVGHFDLVSKKLGKNCGFFNNSIFLGHMSFLGPHTVIFDICTLARKNIARYINSAYVPANQYSSPSHYNHRVRFWNFGDYISSLYTYGTNEGPITTLIRNSVGVSWDGFTYFSEESSCWNVHDIIWEFTKKSSLTLARDYNKNFFFS